MPLELRTSAGIAQDAYDVDGANLASLVRHRVEQRNDGLLVGDGAVQTAQLRVLPDNVEQHPCLADFVVLVHGINAFALKLLREEAFAEAMPERVSYKSVSVHIFLSLSLVSKSPNH